MPATKAASLSYETAQEAIKTPASDEALETPASQEALKTPASQEALKKRAHIKRLYVQDFRNHAAQAVDCDGAFVALCGENGTGKTNLLEAVSMLSGSAAAGRGLRGAAFDALIRKGTQDDTINIDSWRIQADMITDNIPSKLVVSAHKNGGGRRLTLDGAPMRGLEILNEIAPQLWLTPAMDRLFVDGASGRRKFLDRFAQVLFAPAAKYWGQYERAMRERNRLLQDPMAMREQESWLSALEDIMATQGAAIAATRLKAFDVLAGGLLDLPAEDFPKAALALDGDIEAQIRTRPMVDVEDGFRQTLYNMRARDGAAGRALSGPHRSDLVVTHSDKNMPAAKASTGEQKGLLLGLLLAQAHAVLRQTGKAPLLLLDEVAAHLDARRRAALAVLLADIGAQVWITGTDSAIFSDMFAGNYDIKMIELNRV